MAEIAENTAGRKREKIVFGCVVYGGGAAADEHKGGENYHTYTHSHTHIREREDFSSRSFMREWLLILCKMFSRLFHYFVCVIFLLSAWGKWEKLFFSLRQKGKRVEKRFSSRSFSFSFVFRASGIQWEIIKTILRIFSLFRWGKMRKLQWWKKLFSLEFFFSLDVWTQKIKIIYHFFRPFCFSDSSLIGVDKVAETKEKSSFYSPLFFSGGSRKFVCFLRAKAEKTVNSNLKALNFSAEK